MLLNCFLLNWIHFDFAHVAHSNGRHYVGCHLIVISKRKSINYSRQNNWNKTSNSVKLIQQTTLSHQMRSNQLWQLKCAQAVQNHLKHQEKIIFKTFQFCCIILCAVFTCVNLNSSQIHQNVLMNLRSAIETDPWSQLIRVRVFGEKNVVAFNCMKFVWKRPQQQCRLQSAMQRDV